MVQTAVSAVTPFRKVDSPLTKQITVLQINLVSAVTSPVRIATWKQPKRTEELTSEICAQLIELIYKFPQIKTVDLLAVPGNELWFQATGGKANGKQVIVRSNLTIY